MARCCMVLYHLQLRGRVRCLDTVQMNMRRLLYFQVSRRPGFGSTTNLCYVGWLLALKWGYFPKTTVFAVLDPRPGAPAALPARTRRCLCPGFSLPLQSPASLTSRAGLVFSCQEENLWFHVSARFVKRKVNDFLEPILKTGLWGAYRMDVWTYCPTQCLDLFIYWWCTWVFLTF